ncbi:receptor-like protein 2 isoform X1 [Olea europaea var. sylvestris]|uniref:receptor-like protein 2 isoform X1 n=1 Tax=Olea europaea var. sylvestris TaxID=158386 RepID=UPI000C1D047F|nr:receptor-like protein 2 isoform X1 [Olea europaea var. sylvestris]
MNKKHRMKSLFLIYSMPVLITFLFLLLSSVQVLSCDMLDHDSLLSFYEHISSPPPASPLNCCKWEGITCNSESRVTQLSLPGKGLSGTITPFLGNLSFLSHINLSHNHFSGSLPVTLFRTLNHLESLDLSFNFLSGWFSDTTMPISIQIIDLSSNRFNGLIDYSNFFHRASSLISFNISNNKFMGPLPSSLCITSSLVKMLDFSMNKFSGNISQGSIGRCSKLEVFRAGFNSLSGPLPSDLYSVKTLTEISLPNNQLSGTVNNSIVLLSNISLIDLNQNGLTGEIPTDIGMLSNLKQLILHTNALNGSVPPSLMNCTNLKMLLLRNNLLGGKISSLDFSNLHKLEVIDFGNNSFVGNIPDSLCLCRSLTAVRLSHNQLDGQIPACTAALKSLSYLNLAGNNLFNVLGAFRILMECDNLTVLFLARCFHEEPVPDHYSLQHFNVFQNLKMLSLGGCQLKGTIPTWLWSMPSLFDLNLTQNHLWGELPREIGGLKALIADDTVPDLSYIVLPYLSHNQEVRSLSNVRRAIKIGNNNLSGNIPVELCQLRLLEELDLNNNNFSGSIPSELSHLVNLEKLDMSENNLSGKIPESLTSLHFLSSFSVENNDLQGEIPRGGQFDTFPATSFEGNPKLCGFLIQRSCTSGGQVEILQPVPAAEESESLWYAAPFGLGYLVGFFAISISLLFKSSWKCFV